MKLGHVHTQNKKIRSQGLLTAAMLFFSFFPGKTEVAAQRLVIDASVQQAAGSLMQVRGDLIIQHRPDMKGKVVLGGNLLDEAGLSVQDGIWKFNGTGQDQLIAGSATILLKHMIIAADARVVLPHNTSLTVAGNLVNDHPEAGLLLESTEESRASLLHYQPGVIASVLYQLPEQDNVHRFISSPVDKQDIEPEFHQVFDSFGSWYEKHQSFVLFTHQHMYPTFRDANENVLYFLPAKGYSFRYQPLRDKSLSRVFHGDLHQGEQQFILMVQSHPLDPFSGFNLMGNPYPSAIDWLAEEGWSGREYLVGGEKGDHVMWLWNDSIQNYGASHPRSCTRLHNGNKGLIQSMNAFWVQAAHGNDGKKIGMDDRVRLHSADAIPLQKEKIQGQAIRIILTRKNSPHRDEVIVELGHHRTGAVRKKFPFSGKAPQLYMLYDKLAYGNLLTNKIKHEAQLPLENSIREGGAYSILLLDAMKSIVHIHLEAITREAGNYSIRLEYDEEIDESISLVLKGPGDDKDIRPGRSYHLHAAEEEMRWHMDLLIRP